jgi:hypothetical protein
MEQGETVTLGTLGILDHFSHFYCWRDIMSDKFTCCPIDQLLRWILEEEKQGQIFGIRKELFFDPHSGDAFKTQRYGQILETPIGVAAGPHTQLSQNIISAWLTGVRAIIANGPRNSNWSSLLTNILTPGLSCTFLKINSTGATPALGALSLI